MFDVSANSHMLPAGWRLLHSVQHPLYKQVYIGFPNGYAVSMVQGDGTYSDANDGTVELGYAAWDGVDTDSRELVSFDWATTVLQLGDSIQGWVPIVTAVATCTWLASLPAVDYAAATAEQEYEDAPMEEPEYDDDSYAEFEEWREPYAVEPYFSGEFDND